MYNIRLIFLLLIVLIQGNSFSLLAQQTPIFANYNYNPIILNPAHAGYYETTDISVFTRGYFNTTDGSPRDLGASFNTSFRNEHQGFGGSVISDEIGVTKTTHISLAYAYKIHFDKNFNRPIWWAYNPHILSFGITGGLLSYNENLLDLGITNDPNFDHNINSSIPTLGIGILYNREEAYIGFSVPNLLGTSLASDQDIDLQNVYYGYAGLRLFTSRYQKLLWNPSVLFKYTQGAPAQIDFNSTFNYKNSIELGFGYRTNTSINYILGFKLSNHFRFLYQFNQGVRSSPIKSSHGIVLSYRFGNGFGN